MNQPIPVQSQPGIKRDGTQFEGNNYVDGQWCRFQRGLPRKMGGCQSITSTLLEKIYGITSYSSNGAQYQHLGSATTLLQVRLTATGAYSGAYDRTPAALVNSPNNIWQFDVQFDTTGGALNYLFAHAAPNLAAIDSEVETSVYYGDVVGTGALPSTLMDPQSGGVVVLAPYILTYGNAGRVDVYIDPSAAPVNSANVTGMKIVKGLPLRGSGNGPAGIFWSLDSVIRATFSDPADGYFAFDTISASSSILSSRAVVEYDGVYYWAGVDRFLMFNGVVREVPNSLNLNWFYDNLNFAQRQKVWATTVPRFGEIWWCYPRGQATECTHAVVFNVREGTWYDTELLNSGRSDGLYAKVFNKPYMVDVDATDTGYTLWQHETGVNRVLGAQAEPIPSWFETSDITFLVGENPSNRAMSVAYFEPDFVQSGDLSLIVRGRVNARAPTVDSDPYTIVETATTADEQIIALREMRRLMRFKIMSNTLDGDYQMGRCIAHVGQGDGRMAS